ncbi:MAG: PstA family ABC transporter permease [Acidimicrobiales bacterium]
MIAEPDRSSIRRRRRREVGFRAGTLVALALIIGPAAWILIGVVLRALPHWRWSVLVTTTQGAAGGLSNAIVGTLALMAGVLVVAGSLGVLAGVFLSELAPVVTRWWSVTGILRSATDVLAGMPSITLGFVGYLTLVLAFHWGYSLLPAVLVLSVMVVPYIAKSTESALRQVPTTYREGAEALGMRQGYALRKVVLRSAIPGVTTGLLIALAISSGETAPLLYTAGFSNTLPKVALIHHPVAYLTYLVYNFYDYPTNAAHYLAYDAALVLLVLVLILLVAARIIVASTQRHADR